MNKYQLTISKSFKIPDRLILSLTGTGSHSDFDF